MNEKNCHHSPRATLATLGLKLQPLGFLAPIREKVRIAQKTIKHDPLDRLQDAFITILAGARGLSEINTRLHADPALLNGLLEFIEAGRIIRITLNQAAPLAREMALALAKLLACDVEGRHEQIRAIWLTNDCMF